MPTRVEKREKKLSLFSDDPFANFTDLFGGKLFKWSTLILLNILVIKNKQTNVKKRSFCLTVVLVVDSSNSIVLLAVSFFFLLRKSLEKFFIYLDSS